MQRKRKCATVFVMKRFCIASLVAFTLLLPVFSFGQKDSQRKSADSAQTHQEQSASQRIVSLVPSTTEIIFALDAQNKLVARTDFCTWPPEVQAIPSVGGFDGKTISLERIVAFQPDLVCIADVMHNHLIQPLEALGIKVFLSTAQKLDQIYEEIVQLGALTGHQTEAQNLVAQIESQLEEAQLLVAKAQPSQQNLGTKVYWEVSAAPYFSPGQDSFITDLLVAMGLENIFGTVAQAYPQVNEEGIIAGQPDFIFFPDYNFQGAAGAQAIASRTGWQKLPAVVHSKIYPVDSDLFSRPGPRVGTMALELARLITGQTPASESAQ